MAKSPYRERGFYDPQSEVNRLFDEMLGNAGGAPAPPAGRSADAVGSYARRLTRGGRPANPGRTSGCQARGRGDNVPRAGADYERRAKGRGARGRNRLLRQGAAPRLLSKESHSAPRRRGGRCKRPLRGRRFRDQGTGRGGAKGTQTHSDTRPGRRGHRRLNCQEAETVLRHSPIAGALGLRRGGTGGSVCPKAVTKTRKPIAAAHS